MGVGAAVCSSVIWAALNRPSLVPVTLLVGWVWLAGVLLGIRTDAMRSTPHRRAALPKRKTGSRGQNAGDIAQHAGAAAAPSPSSRSRWRHVPIALLALVLAAGTSVLMVLSIVPDYLIENLGLPLLIAIPLVAGGLLWMRSAASREPSEPSDAAQPARIPSFAWLVWPVAVLPVSALLTNFVGRCPGNPPGISLRLAAVAYFAPPLLVAAALLVLRWGGRVPNAPRVFVLSVLSVCFLAACLVDSFLFLFSIMGEC
jgi:hypothetical protein